MIAANKNNISYIEINETKVSTDYYFCDKFLWVPEHFESKYDHSYLNMDEHIDEFYVEDKILYCYPNVVVHFIDGTKTTTYFKHIDFDKWIIKNEEFIKQNFIVL